MAAFDIEALPGVGSSGMISVSMVRPVDYRLITINREPVLNNNQPITP